MSLAGFAAFLAWGLVVAVPANGVHADAAAPQDVDALIDGVVEAYGGADNLRAVEAYRLEATMQAHSRGQQARVTRISQGPRRLQVGIDYPDAVEIRTIDGDEGFSGASLDTLTPARGPALAAMRLQAARANVPWILDAMRSRVTRVQAEGPHEVLEIRFSDTEAMSVWIDADTHRAMMTVSSMRAGPMEVVFRAEFSDFREVDGVLFPFHEENFAGGTHTATTTVDRIIVNPSAAELTLPRDGRRPMPTTRIRTVAEEIRLR